MKNITEITELRQVGFYQLKRLLGLGDDRLRMVLAVGNVKPKYFSAGGKRDEFYNLFDVKEALKDLAGRDVQQEYEQLKRLEEMDPGTRAKFEDVILRLDKRQTKRTG
jgi:chorismate mutase